jgi:hypothetical protein
MPNFHLVADEIVAVASDRFRVQVWHAESRPLVLLMAEAR